MKFDEILLSISILFSFLFGWCRLKTKENPITVKYLYLYLDLFIYNENRSIIYLLQWWKSNNITFGFLFPFWLLKITFPFSMCTNIDNDKNNNSYFIFHFQRSHWWHFITHFFFSNGFNNKTGKNKMNFWGKQKRIGLLKKRCWRRKAEKFTKKKNVVHSFRNRIDSVQKV